MDVHMRDIGKIIIKEVLELRIGGMNRYMKENLKMGKKMELEYINGKMILYIMENGSIIIFMDLEFSKIKLKKCIKVNLL